MLERPVRKECRNSSRDHPAGKDSKHPRFVAHAHLYLIMLLGVLVLHGLNLMSTATQRRLPIGAELLDRRGAHFRVWAPRRKRVDVVFEDARIIPLETEEGGYFSGAADPVAASALYRFRLDGSDRCYPDPASRFQPAGPHGPSQVVDPDIFRWTDDAWKGIRIEGQIIYEMHIGTFTPEGRWTSAERHLPELADLGVTVLEIMPVAAFAGRFGWGYDGVDPFAPSQLYGSPDDFRSFVDRAHSLRLAVILDAVYNHLGPDGNYLREFSHNYFTTKYRNEWGDAINFDGKENHGVREFFIANARYWIDEFHLDGFRFDATQQIFDESREHILTAIGREARRAAAGRDIVLIAENEPQMAKIARPVEKGGYGLDALWNDDFHHSASVAMNKRTEFYYSDYLGAPQEFISSMKWGFLFQGQKCSWQKKRRGSPSTDLKPESFVIFIQNHDQVANSANGARIHRQTSPSMLRAMTALLLLAPGTPLLFQGQEFGASSPFRYFADHHPDLAPLVQEGRERFMKQFTNIGESNLRLPSPHDPATFETSCLHPSDRQANANLLALHRDLIQLRRSDAVFQAQRSDWMYGAVLSLHAFALRFFGKELGDRLIIANLGRDLPLVPAPEPLLAPPYGTDWTAVWSSESSRYGGAGNRPANDQGQWFITGESVIVLSSKIDL